MALGGTGENGGVTGRGGGVGEEEEEADGTAEDNGRGEVGLNEEVRSKETVGWSRGKEDAGLGESGGGRDWREGLEEIDGETKRGAGLVEIGGEELRTEGGGGGGGRVKEVDGGRGGREGS